MYFFLKANPFVRLLGAFVAGILLHQFCAPVLAIYHLFLIFSFLGFLLAFFFFSKRRSEAVFGVSLFLFLCCFAGLWQQRQQTNAQLRAYAEGESRDFIVQIKDVPEEKERSWKLYLQVLAMKTKEGFIAQKAQSICYVAKDTMAARLKVGDVLSIHAKFREHGPPENAFDFNYGQYLRRKGIYYTTYLPGDAWQYVNREKSSLRPWALQCRQYVLGLYEKNGLKGEELGVFSALTLGYKQELDANLRTAFANAGAMHILAVSGMHVGIVYLILMQMSSLFGLIRKKYKWQYVFVILGIWFYALLTGMSPSVTRAAVMATFLLLGKVIGKRTNIYNSMAASAFVLLLYRTSFLFDVGFQLSYLALLGIVSLHQAIYGALYVKPKLLQAAWKLTAMGVAAQIGTFPLSIFYFHQFPVYFWLSGVFVVILAYLMMFGAVGLILLSPFGQLSHYVGEFCVYVTKALDLMVSHIGHLPGAVLSFLCIQGWQVILLYGFVVLMFRAINLRKGRSLLYALLCLFLVVFFYRFESWRSWQQTDRQHCSYRQQDVCLYREAGNACWIFADSLDAKQLKWIEQANAYYHILPKNSQVVIREAGLKGLPDKAGPSSHMCK